jgi:hypothetical protein
MTSEESNFEYIKDRTANITYNSIAVQIPSREVIESNQMLSGIATKRISKNEPFISVFLNSDKHRITNKTTNKVTKLLNNAAVKGLLPKTKKIKP